MGKIVLRIMGMADGGSTPFDNQFVKQCNFEAGFGTLAVDVTPFADQALQFTTGIDALNYWQTISSTEPLRPDGEPNRPLAGVNVELDEI